MFQIMVVDDDRNTRRLLQAVLEADGYKVLTAENGEDALALESAYAITVHKSQGCEFEVVILPLLGGFEKLYYRNLLYTAVTRSKKLLILIGSQQKIYQMVDNNRRCHRYTCLKHMMTEGTLHETDTSAPEQLPLSD